MNINDINIFILLSSILIIDEIVQEYVRQYKIADFIPVLQNDNFVEIHGITGSSISFFLAAMFDSSPFSILFIAENIDEANIIYHDIKSIQNQEVIIFNDSFKKLSRGIEFSKKSINLRLQSIFKITQNNSKNIVITYPEALAERIVGIDLMKKKKIEIYANRKYKLQELIEICESLGLSRNNFVYEPGQYSIRGSIIDIFSFGFPLPYRIEMNDNEIESIRQFDIETQTSINTVSFIHITPNSTNLNADADKAVAETAELFKENFVIFYKNKEEIFDKYVQIEKLWHDYKKSLTESAANTEFNDILQYDLFTSSFDNLIQLFQLPKVKIN